MAGGKVTLIAADHSEIRLRLRIGERERVITKKDEMFRQCRLDQAEQSATDRGMQGGLGHFLDDDSAD